MIAHRQIRRNRRRPVAVALGAALIGYSTLVLIMAGCQRHLIYYPSTGSEARLLAVAAEADLEPWRDAKGALIGWRGTRADAGEPEASVIVFHGNAGMAANRAYYRDAIERAARGRWQVLIFEYPGFGARAGKPGERSITAAAHEALEHFLTESTRPVYLLGESLGTGVACSMAAAFPERVTGLILVTPFTSLPDVGAHHYPFLPVRLMMRDRYDNRNALRNYHGPVAMLLAERDTIVPEHLGRKLYDEYHGPKRLSVSPGTDHNTLDLSAANPWWNETVAFLEQSG